MKALNEEDSWILFKNFTCSCVDHTLSKYAAKKVANQCQSLLIAIVIVGKRLRNKTSLDEWKVALQRSKYLSPITSKASQRRSINP